MLNRPVLNTQDDKKSKMAQRNKLYQYDLHLYLTDLKCFTMVKNAAYSSLSEKKYKVVSGLVMFPKGTPCYLIYP